MAQMTVDGLTELGISLEKIAQLPDEVVVEMLEAQAETTIEYQKRSITEKGLSPHGKFRASIKGKRGKKDGRPYIDVYPQGDHHTNPNGKKVRNADIGFINEFGAKKKNISASQWMRTANEKAADDVEAAGLKVYDDFLQQNNL